MSVPDNVLIRKYAAGESLRTIAADIKQSHQYVRRHLLKNGVSLRPYQGSGPEHSQWKGGRVQANGGYWRVWISADDPMSSMRNHHGYVLEHRLVMARKLGRPLRRSETVHHINGDRSDNQPENLQICQGKHGKHVVVICLDCGSHNVGHAPILGAP